MTPMERREVVVKHKLGLHARPAAAFVQLARGFEAEIIVEKNGERVNGKSIMGVLMLAIAHGETIAIEVNGPDASAATAKLTAFLENGEF